MPPECNRLCAVPCRPRFKRLGLQDTPELARAAPQDARRHDQKASHGHLRAVQGTGGTGKASKRRCCRRLTQLRARQHLQTLNGVRRLSPGYGGDDELAQAPERVLARRHEKNRKPSFACDVVTVGPHLSNQAFSYLYVQRAWQKASTAGPVVCSLVISYV